MSSRNAKQWSAIALISVAFLATWLVYLSQPSSRAFDEDGTPLSRLVEMLVMPTQAQQFFEIQSDGIPEAVVDKVPLFAAAALWFWLAYLIGRPVVAAARVRLSVAEFRGLSTLLGLTVFSTLTLSLGLAGLLSSRWPLAGCIAALAALSLALWRRLRSPPNSPLETAPVRQEVQLQREPLTVWATRITQVLICLLAFGYVQFGAIAPSEFDVLEYHLGAPKDFHQAGKVFFSPHNVYANMPLGVEMHSLAAMTLVGGPTGWWTGAMIGKVIIAGFSLLGAYLIFGFAGRHFGTPINWFAAGLLLAIGGNIHSATTGLVDFALAVYVLASALALEAVASNTGTAESPLPRSVWFQRTLMLGILTFGAMTCKYTGLFFCVVPIGLAIGYLLLRRRLPCPTLTGISASGAAFTLTLAPWLGKNLISTGNPVYPLANRIFGGLDADIAERWADAHTAGGSLSAYSFGQLAGSAWQFLLVSGFQHPTVIFAAVGGLLVAGWQFAKPPSSRLDGRGHDWCPPIDVWSYAALAAFVLAVWWLATHRLDRFWFPAMPMFVILAASFLHWVHTRVSAGLVTAITLVSILFSLQVLFSGSAPNDARWLVPQREFYNSLTAPTPRSTFGDATAWCNNQFSDENQTVALVGQAAIFPYTFPYLYATCFDEPPVKSLIAGMSAKEQRVALKDAGISHIVIDWTEIGRYRSPGNYGFDDWPSRWDVDRLIEYGVVETMQTPFSTASFQALKVLPPENASDATNPAQPEPKE